MMRRTFVEAAADAAFEARLAGKFAEAAARAADQGECDCAEALREASRCVRVRSIQHRAEACVLAMRDQGWSELDDDW
jgi:hypothetical protein